MNFSARKADRENEERLEGLREWYKRRSADFTSLNYLKDKQRRSLSAQQANAYEKYEQRMEMEKENFLRHYDKKLRAALSKYQPNDGKQKFAENKEKVQVKPSYTRTINTTEITPDYFLQSSDEEEEEEEIYEEEENILLPQLSPSSPSLLLPTPTTLPTSTAENKNGERNAAVFGNVAETEKNASINYFSSPPSPTSFASISSPLQLLNQSKTITTIIHPPTPPISSPPPNSSSSFSSPSTNFTSILPLPFPTKTTKTPLPPPPSTTNSNFSSLPFIPQNSKNLLKNDDEKSRPPKEKKYSPPDNIFSFTTKTTNFSKKPISSPSSSSTSFSSSNLAKWLHYFSSFHEHLIGEVEAFEADPEQKQLRIHLSRTLAERINDSAKKNCSNQEIAMLSNFLVDLFEGQRMRSCRDGTEFVLDAGNSRQHLFAMATICDRYIEQIKWESELIDLSRLVIVLLALKRPLFYEVFCAKVVGALLLLSFDIGKIISKLEESQSDDGSEQQLLAHQQDALSHWISDEQATFRLFCKVQLALKSSSSSSSTEGGVRGVEKSSSSEMLAMKRGAELLRLIFVDAAHLPSPVPLCTPFVLGELLHAKRGIIQHCPEFESELVNVLVPAIKSRLPAMKKHEMDSNFTTDKLSKDMRAILLSRQNYLVCLLEAELDKFDAAINKKTAAKSATH